MNRFIEWLDGKTHCRGVVRKDEKGKILAVTLTGKTVSVAAKKVLLRHEDARESEAFFAEIDGMAREVDLELLHETVGAGERFALSDLAVFWYSADPPSSLECSAILAACADGAPWFKLEPKGTVRSGKAEDLERARREAELKALHEGGEGRGAEAP